MKNGKRVGLALSGGGYRAAAFHLGTLRKLKELGALDKVDVLSTISGGSITGAAYCIKTWDYDEFERQMITTLTTKSVIRYVLTSFAFLKTALFFIAFIGGSVWALFTDFAWLSPVLLITMIVLILLFQYKIFPISKLIEKAYDSFFFNDLVLSKLVEYPVIAIGSTNIQTCRPFTFSKDRMSDSTYSAMKPPVLFNHENFPVSRAVMASSCVPFAFAPVIIGKEYFAPGCYDKQHIPVLVDGGVYDNQGIHKLSEPKSFYKCDIVVTSDAGNKPPFVKSYNNVMVLLIRVMDVFMVRIKGFQMVANLYRNTTSGGGREITYVSLGWDLDRLIPGFVYNLKEKNIVDSVIKHHNIPEEWVKNVKAHEQEIRKLLEDSLKYEKIKEKMLNEEDMKVARSVGTNLTKLSPRQVDCLIRQAANITELQVRLYCPSLL
jgi:NTE family protein